MRVDALLCDAATVREGLLHILGGGVTRIWRTNFPAPMGVQLAVMVTLEQGEPATDHTLRAVVMGQDGEQIVAVEGSLRAEVNPVDPPVPGIELQLPLVLDTRDAALPAPGIYSINLMINKTTYMRVVRFPPKCGGVHNEVHYVRATKEV